MKTILATGILLISILGCSVLGEKKPEITTIREIKTEYQKSEDTARQKFGGKELTILGNVTYRSEVNPTIRVGSTTDSDIPITVPDIDCHFEESDPLFKNVAQDDLIKVRGVLKFTDSGMEINPCKFVPVTE